MVTLPESITSARTAAEHRSDHQYLHTVYNHGRNGAYLMVATANSPSWARNAADYLGDGTADNVQIQQALDALPAGGGTVLLAPGDFSLAATVNVQGNGTVLAGTGMGYREGTSQSPVVASRMSVASGFSGSAAVRVQEAANLAPVASVTIRDLAIDGGNVGSGVDGIHFRAHSSQIVGVGVHRMSGNAIHCQGYPTWQCYDTYLERILASYNAGAGIFWDGDSPDQHAVLCVFYQNGYGFRIAAGSEQITNCHTYSNGTNVWFDGGGARTKIVNLKCENADHHGIHFDNSSGTGTSSAIIVGCNFKGNGQAAANTYDHIFLSNAGIAGHSLITIVGCVFSYIGGTLPRYGINCPSSASQNVVISGCNFGGASAYGTAAVNVADTAIVTTSGNGFASGCPGRTEQRGITSVANGGTIPIQLARTPTFYAAAATGSGVIVAITAATASGLTVSMRDYNGQSVTTAQPVAWRAEV